jgi:hypothetical protein
MSLATAAPPSPTLAAPPARAEPLWPLYALLAAALSITVGLMWDISWHRSIGRDTFWSPPHLLEQLAALIAGLGCGWLVLRTTFAGTSEERARGVRFWGFVGPLGAWVAIWGTLTMITSAPFDDWWHDAYGLDVKVLSPPHMVLALGMGGIQVGAMLMALARQNRAGPEEARRLGLVYLAVAAVMLTMHVTTLIERAAFPNQMHSSGFYVVTALAIPAFLTALARPSRMRWPATTIAGLYMALTLAMMWLLQLSPATPRLAPIFNPVDRMVPPPFPLLLVVPALAIDVLLKRVRLNDWWLAPLIGVAFVATLLAAQWFFADFLLSPGARNTLFGADRWDYNIQPGPWRYQYWETEEPARFFAGLGRAVVLGSISARLGLWWGRGMARVQR